MLADAAGDAFELERHLPDFQRILVVGELRIGEQLVKLRLFLARLLQRNAGREGNQLGNLVGKAVGLALHTGHVTHHGLGRHGAEGDDLRHRLAAIVVGHIINHAIAAVHAEVDIEVGHGHTFGIEEALEQQVVGQGVEIGDLECIGHQRAGAGATSRPDRHAVLLGPADKVHDDEEVTREAHLVDDAELEIQAVGIHLAPLGVVGCCRVQDFRQALLKALARMLDEILVDGHPGRHRIVGQEVLAQRQVQRAAAGNLDRVGQGFGNVGKQLGHLRRRFQVLLLRVVARTLGISQHIALRDTHAHLMRLEILRREKAHVVGRHHRTLQRIRQRYRGMKMTLVTVAAGTGDFQIGTLRKMLQPAREARHGLLGVGTEQGHADIAAPAEQHDEPLAALLQPAPLHLRLTQFLALDIGTRNDPDEVAVAGLVHHQHGHFTELVAFADHEVGTEYRLDALALCALVELHQRIQVHAVTDGHGRHAGRQAGLHQRINADNAVFQRKFAAYMQMDECRHQEAPPKRAASASRTGAKERRCSGMGPCVRSAARCSAVA